MSIQIFIRLIIFSVQIANNIDFRPSLDLNYGVLESGRFYSLTMSRPFDERGRAVLWQVYLDRPGQSQRNQIPWLGTPRGDSFALRWSIDKSILRALILTEENSIAFPLVQFPIGAAHFLDPETPNGYEKLAKKYNLDLKAVKTVGISSADFGLLAADNRDRFFKKVYDDRKTQCYEKSFWVSPAGLISEFMLSDKVLHVGIANRVEKGHGNPPYMHLSARREIKVDFQEPFMVFANQSHHFFLTMSGKIWCCDRLDLCDEWPTSLHAYHVDPHRPVRTVVAATDVLRTFVACVKRDDPYKQVWFELEEGAKETEYDPNSTQLSDKFPKAIETAARFAQFLKAKNLFVRKPTAE